MNKDCLIIRIWLKHIFYSFIFTFITFECVFVVHHSNFWNQTFLVWCGEFDASFQVIFQNSQEVSFVAHNTICWSICGILFAIGECNSGFTQTSSSIEEFIKATAGTVTISQVSWRIRITLLASVGSVIKFVVNIAIWNGVNWISIDLCW